MSLDILGPLGLQAQMFVGILTLFRRDFADRTSTRFVRVVSLSDRSPQILSKGSSKTMKELRSDFMELFQEKGYGCAQGTKFQSRLSADQTWSIVSDAHPLV